MELELIRQQLHKRYIEPTKKKREKYIGVEIEMPIVNLSKNAVDFENLYYRSIDNKPFEYTKLAGKG